MSTAREKKAFGEFKRTIAWIVAIGVIMVAGSLIWLSRQGPLHTHMVVAVVGGVFFSMMLGCGLFAAAFFSDKSGYDQEVADATIEQEPGAPTPSTSVPPKV